MNREPEDAASAALRDPLATLSYPLLRWESLIAQARSANLLGKLATCLDEANALDAVPAAPRAHLHAALAEASAQRDSVRREIEHLRVALAEVAADVVLLKGSAYLIAALPASRGRMFNDVDILVPRARLHEVEAALMLHGWATTHLNAYDQRYYREWMHELPPMRHVTRATIVDVHHAILPITARLHPDSAKLLAAAQPVADEPRFRVLAPADMVLHSATHLFFNEELGQGLRDLSDLDALLRDFARLPSFWTILVARADELDLARPLHYALRYAARILHTPVPKNVLAVASCGATPPRFFQAFMDALFTRALRPEHPDAADAFTPLARKLLYARAHWLRMPPLLLIRHLTIKALRREPAENDRVPA